MPRPRGGLWGVVSCACLLVLLLACDTEGGRSVSIEPSDEASDALEPAPTASPRDYWWSSNPRAQDRAFDECRDGGGRWSAGECEFYISALYALGDDARLLLYEDRVDLLGAGYAACDQMTTAPDRDVMSVAPPADWPSDKADVFSEIVSPAARTLCTQHEAVFGSSKAEREEAAASHWWSYDEQELDAAFQACGGEGGTARFTDAECTFLLSVAPVAAGFFVEHEVDLLAAGYDACTLLDEHPEPQEATQAMKRPNDWPEDAEFAYAMTVAYAATFLCPEHAEVGQYLTEPQNMAPPPSG